MAKRQCAIASHLKVAYGSWTWIDENPWPPWLAVIKAPLWKEPKYEGLRGLLQKPVAKPVCEKTDTGLVSIRCARESLVETSTGKLIAESGRVELMAMRCGVPVPSIISSLPFAPCVIEVPRLYTAGLHNLVAQLLLSGVPVFIAGESAHVKAAVAALKATVAEDMYQCDVAIYNLSTKTPLYTSTSHLVSVCSPTLQSLENLVDIMLAKYTDRVPSRNQLPTPSRTGTRLKRNENISSGITDDMGPSVKAT